MGSAEHCQATNLTKGKAFDIQEGNLTVVAVDCSTRAIQLLEQRLERELSARSSPGKCDQPVEDNEPFHYGLNVFEVEGQTETTIKRFVTPQGHSVITAVCDVTKDMISASVCRPGTVNLAFLVFVLSAVPYEFHALVVERLWQSLASDGAVVFRDYGQFDMAQLRFSKSSTASRVPCVTADPEASPDQESVRSFVRHDGTLSHFFNQDDLRHLFCYTGRFKEIQNESCTASGFKESFVRSIRVASSIMHHLSCGVNSRIVSTKFYLLNF